MCSRIAWDKAKEKYKKSGGKWVLKEGYLPRIDGISLDSAQINKFSRLYEKVQKVGFTETPTATAIALFRREYHISGGRWVLREAFELNRPTDINEAVWSAAYKNNLPDSAFLHIEKGGKKDSEGKTVPRSLRHLPVEDAEGNVNLSHVRNAISQAPKTKDSKGNLLSDSVVSSIQAKARKILDNYREEYEGDEKIQIYESQDPEVSEWTETFDAACPVIEAVEEAAGEEKVKKLRVTLLREGFSLNIHKKTRRKDYYRYYPAKTLEGAMHLFEDLPLYVGDLGHDGAAKLRDRVGPQEKVWLDEVNGHKEIRADYKVYPDNDWLYERAKLDPLAFGPSIEGAGASSTGEVGGKPAAVITKLAEVARARLVEKPAAGGRTEILESEGGKNVSDKLTLDELREDYPDLVAQVEETAVNAYKVSQDDADKDERIKVLEQEKTDTEKKLKELTDKVAEAESEKLVEAALPEDMPDVTKNMLKEQLKGVVDEKKIKEAVDGAVKYIEEIAKDKGFVIGKPVHNGAGNEDDKTGVKEAQDKLDEMAGVEKKEEPAKEPDNK